MTQLAHDDDGSFTMMANYADMTQRSKADENLIVFFHTEAVQNMEKTMAEGRPIFEEKDFITIRVPGDKRSIITRQVRIGHTPRHDNVRFKRIYAEYKAGREQAVVGTPLKEWPLVSRSQVLEMAHFGIQTVEQLAAVPDTICQQHMGLAKLKGQARAFLDMAAEGSDLTKIQAEADDLKADNKRMQAQMLEMQAALRELQGKKITKPVAVEEEPVEEEALEFDEPETETAETDDPDLDDEVQAAAGRSRRRRN